MLKLDTNYNKSRHDVFFIYVFIYCLFIIYSFIYSFWIFMTKYLLISNSLWLSGTITHCGLVMSYDPYNLVVNIASGNGLSLVRHQAITRTNFDLLSTGQSGTNFTEISVKIRKFSFKKKYSKNVVWKMLAILFGLQCVLILKYPLPV